MGLKKKNENDNYVGPFNKYEFVRVQYEKGGTWYPTQFLKCIPEDEKPYKVLGGAAYTMDYDASRDAERKKFGITGNHTEEIERDIIKTMLAIGYPPDELAAELYIKRELLDKRILEIQQAESK